MVYRITDDDIHRVMDGHPPPTDPNQRDAYYIILGQRLRAILTEEQEMHVFLLAGGVPNHYWEWMRNYRPPETTGD